MHYWRYFITLPQNISYENIWWIGSAKWTLNAWILENLRKTCGRNQESKWLKIFVWWPAGRKSSFVIIGSTFCSATNQMSCIYSSLIILNPKVIWHCFHLTKKRIPTKFLLMRKAKVFYKGRGQWSITFEYSDYTKHSKKLPDMIAFSITIN